MWLRELGAGRVIDAGTRFAYHGRGRDNGHSFNQRNDVDVGIGRESYVQSATGAIMAAVRTGGGAIIRGNAYGYLSADCNQYRKSCV